MESELELDDDIENNDNNSVENYIETSEYVNIEDRTEVIGSKNVAGIESMTEENNNTVDVESVNEENITEANTTTETHTTTEVNNRHKRNIKPVERLHPYATHVNNKLESKKKTNI